MARFLGLFFLLPLIIFTESGFAQQTFTYSGEITTDSNTFERPEEDCQTLSGRTVANTGTLIRVEISGNYTITSQQDNFDGFLLLYDSFNPNTPLEGCIVGDDDDGGTRTSTISDVFLEADVTYLIVTTSFASGGFGTFTNTVEGPGRIGETGSGGDFDGSNSNGQIFSRPLASCGGLSSNAPNTRYSAQVFSVSTTGNYGVSSIQTGFDGHIHLYDERFNPFNPVLGCVTGDDDGLGGVGTSQIDSVTLVAGRTYYLVTSGFSDNDSGGFNNTVLGPGAIFTEPGIFTLASLTGGWFDPGLNGSGFNIVAADVGIIFTFYGYLNGEQRWLLSNVVPNDIRIGQTIAVDLRIGDGGQLNNPGAANVVTFGTLFFQLDDCRNATATIQGQGQFAGVQQFFDLSRLVQGTGLDCQ